MASTHEPIHLLEPANLLEPLDLSDQPAGPARPMVDADRASARRVSAPRPASAKRGTERFGRRGRRMLKAAVIVAGAVACFGAGAALPQLAGIGLDRIDVPQPVGKAPPPRVAASPAKSDDAVLAAAWNGSDQNDFAPICRARRGAGAGRERRDAARSPRVQRGRRAPRRVGCASGRRAESIRHPGSDPRRSAAGRAAGSAGGKFRVRRVAAPRPADRPPRRGADPILSPHAARQPAHAAR